MRLSLNTVVRSAMRSSSALRGGVGGGGAPPALDIRASVGTSTSPTSTGTKAVTGVGFQPKVVLDLGVAQTASGAASDYLALGMGAMASSQSSVCVFSAGALTTSNTSRRHSAAAGFETQFNGGVFNSAAKSSFDADGFTRNWTAVDVARILNHICLGGADLEVSLTQQQMNGTNAAQSFAHGLSGAPTGVLFFGLPMSLGPASTTLDLLLNIGAWASTGQFCASISSANGLTTTATRRRLSTTEVLTDLYSSVTRSMAVSSVNATNVNVTYPVTSASGQYYFFMLAIRGAKCQVGTFDCNGSTSPLTISTTGITPKLFLPVFVPVGVDSVGTVQSDLNLTIGASDGTNNVSCGIQDVSGLTTTATIRWQSSNKLAEYGGAGAGTKFFEGTAAFGGESVILTPTTNGSSSFGQGGFLVIGS